MTFVVMELQGRLGNQLFQFASGYAVAHRHGVPFLFTADRVPSVDLLLPELVGDAYRTATRTELLRVGAWPGRGRGPLVVRRGAFHGARLARRLRGRTMPNVVVWNDTGRYRPEIFDLDLPVRIVGHLQSERYFVDVADDVVRMLGFDSEGRAAEPADPPVPTVGISFRRGDYNARGWTLPMRYYEAALDLVAGRFARVRLELFGDDPAFVELAGERLRGFGEVVDHARTDPVTQLRRMAECEHFVLANSTFAWWGAWLGDQRWGSERVVVAPAEFATGDRVPGRWLTIESGVPEF